MHNQILFETESLCPDCLKRIPAFYELKDKKVYLSKECPEHGKCSVLFWRDGDLYKEFHEQSIHDDKNENYSSENKGCPYDCGLCSQHEGGVCTAVVEVTERCNLKCNICFADSDNDSKEPDINDIKNMFETAKKYGDKCSVQISGGEPTVRDDLPEIIKLGKTFKFPHLQVNTNGIRIAEEEGYAKLLKDAGADLIYLQFDGLNDDIYKKIRGKLLLDTKIQAIENCKKAKIGVLLVVTVVPGINLDKLGDIVQFAKNNMPTVRGIHLQPVSYFGRYPNEIPRDEDRCSISDVLHCIEEQTLGELKMDNFVPRKRYDSHCAFSSTFYLSEDGKLQAISNAKQNESDNHKNFAKKTNEFTNKQWRLPENKNTNQEKPMSKFKLRLGTYTLSITGMGFQDVWNIDINRLKGCCVHVVTKDKAIPLCAYHLTSIRGEKLYNNV